MIQRRCEGRRRGESGRMGWGFVCCTVVGGPPAELSCEQGEGKAKGSVVEALR